MIINGNQPHIQPSLSLGNRLMRQLWNVVWLLLFRTSPRPLHPWRAMLLKAFGAKLGKQNHIYPGVKIWAPWNLRTGDHVGVADGATLYSMAEISIGDFSVVSQGSHLCCGSHDFNSPNFQLFAKPICIGARTWVCAEVFIMPGVSIAQGVVVGARSVVTKSITEPWSVHAGTPCVRVAKRKQA